MTVLIVASDRLGSILVALNCFYLTDREWCIDVYRHERHLCLLSLEGAMMCVVYMFFSVMTMNYAIMYTHAYGYKARDVSGLKLTYNKSDGLVILFIVSNYALFMVWIIFMFLIVGFLVYVLIAVLIFKKLLRIFRTLRALPTLSPDDRGRVRSTNIVMLVVSLIGLAVAVCAPVGFLLTIK